MALAFRKVLISVLPCVGTAVEEYMEKVGLKKTNTTRNEPNFRTTPLLIKTGSLMVLCHDHQKRSYLVVCLQQKCFGFSFLLKPKL